MSVLFQVPAYCLGRIGTEEVAEKAFHDIRLGVLVDINPEVVAVSHFFHAVWQRRIEITQQAVNGIHRDLPDAEETEDMVDAVCVEVFGHLAEARFPPSEAVSVHHFPVVSREAPVLTEDREFVRRSTGLTIHIEQVGVNPGVDACA